MSPDHLAWATAKPSIVFPDPLEPYSSILLPDFDVVEYANLPAEEDEVVDGGTEVEDAKASKEMKAEADAARAEGDQQDNPPWCKVSYYM